MLAPTPVQTSPFAAMLRTSKFGYFAGIAAQDDLIFASRLQALDLHAVVLALPVEKGAIVGDGGVVERRRIVVVRPTAVEHELDRNRHRRLR